MDLLILLQSVSSNLDPVTPIVQESYFSLILKGGWVMLPIAILSVLAIYFIIERWLTISKMGKSDSIWQSRLVELIAENKTEQALRFCIEKPYITAKVVEAGIKEINEPLDDIESAMEIASRVQISKMENHMNYLGIIASIAPMLGFLGTIFGVINIFYNISQTTDLDIATISDGLYQKMICSGAGLLVGIVAYSGYYLLNGSIDKAVVNLDKDSNEVLKAIKVSTRNQKN
ncbi:MAG: hypothetical protein RL662_2446 [Bacteroidota bacterium]|jgi:biopolymer transport protein ExbB